MAMTKRFKVTFEFTAKITSAAEEKLKDLVKDLAKKARKGELKGLESELLVQALTHGPDGLIEAIFKSGVRQGVKELMQDTSVPEDGLSISVAPARVEVKR